MGYLTDEKGNRILVTKASGEKEEFVTGKLRSSLERAGASQEIIEEILADILSWAYDGLSTRKIYNRAFSLLRRKNAGPALRYKLKQAIMELGPTGYPFEHFIGILFEKMGYSVKIGQIIEGYCVSHEIDVIGTGNSTHILVECKYGQDRGKHVSVQVPLYVRSRVDDIIRIRKDLPQYKGLTFQGWVVTNTRFTGDSIQFGKCSGLKLLGWDYPQGQGLKELIEKEKIYPVTILNHLTRKEKQILVDQDIVTCALLLKNHEIIETLGLTANKKKYLIQELNDICGPTP